jgi:hypothetical protein
LLKKEYHSSRTVLFFPSRSSQFGTQSSGFKLDRARARDGSFPAKTGMRRHCQRPGTLEREESASGRRTLVLTSLFVRIVFGDVEDGSLDRNPRRPFRIRS